jgi:malonyl-CoA O-methyltransferase
MVLRLDKDKIARCFRRSLSTYDAAARVQKELAVRLLQCLEEVPDTAFRRVLEIGCCTGVLTEMLCDHKPVQTLFVNDLVAEFEEVVLKRISRRNSLSISSLFGDIETLALPSEISLVLSGATFQWLADLPAFFVRLGRELTSGSYLAFSLFGPGTLQEFSQLISVGLGYRSDEEICSLLEKDFVLEKQRSFQEQLFFPSVREILSHVRATGVGGVSEYRWSREALARFEGRYREKFEGPEGLPVSYSCSCFVVRRR